MEGEKNNMNIQDLIRERVIGNIKTGKKNEKGIPEKLPYFHVEEDKGTSYDMVEIFKQLYPGQPTKLKIRFTSENPFNFKFKRYVNGKAVCIGNGTKAITVGKDSKNNNTQIEYIRELVESNLDALSLANISIFYCLLGIYYKRKSVSIFIAENYLNKSLELSSSNSKVYAYSLFQLISLCARTNRVALAYSYCEKARNIFNRLNNYTTLFYIDFSQCNCLISMGLYDFATAKLKELLSDINQTNKEHVPKIHHSLAWCYLLNCQYSECIKYTNLAIENKDPSCDLCYFIPYSYYKQNEYLKCLDYIESHLEYADDFYKPFLQAISARIQKQNVDFEKNIILYYQSLLQNNVYEDIPLIQSFILDYYTETNNKDMMIKILIDIKSFNDKDLTLKNSTLFTTSQS